MPKALREKKKKWSATSSQSSMQETRLPASSSLQKGGWLLRPAVCRLWNAMLPRYCRLYRKWTMMNGKNLTQWITMNEQWRGGGGIQKQGRWNEVSIRNHHSNDKCRVRNLRQRITAVRTVDTHAHTHRLCWSKACPPEQNKPPLPTQHSRGKRGNQFEPNWAHTHQYLQQAGTSA